MVFQSAEVEQKEHPTQPTIKSMRIAFNCRSFMNKQYTGIGRYASRLINGLGQIDEENDYLLYAPKGLFNSKRIVPEVSGKRMQLKIDRFNRGLKKSVGKVDIYHAPSPEIFDIDEAKIIVTIHDLVYKAFPEGHTEETLRLTDEQFRFFLPKAAKIICVSQNTANDLKEHFNVEDERIHVIYSGIDQNLFYKIDEEEEKQADAFLASKGISEQYILFVGTIEPRKNLTNLLKSFSILKEKFDYSGKLVISGMTGWKSENTIKDLGIEKDILLLGFLEDQELRWLYNKADVFVFPSLYEGFGYPIIEAFSCGCAVVTSTAASCPELAGEAGFLVDPHEVEKIAEGIHHVVADEGLNNQMVSEGLERAKAFNYIDTAKETLKLYREVYES